MEIAEAVLNMQKWNAGLDEKIQVKVEEGTVTLSEYFN